MSLGPLRLAPLAITTAFAVMAATCGREDAGSAGDGAREARVGRISWSATRQATGSGLAREAFVALATAAIEALPPLDIEGARPVVDVRGILDETDDGPAILLEAKARGEGLPVPVEAGVVAKGGGTGDAQGALRLTKSGLEDLSRALGSMFRICAGKEAAWIRALDSAEADEQILAAEALSTIGDPKAVPYIIESIRRGDLRSEVRAIETMARIGGAEARAYVEMTALGHELPEVRRISKDALDRMK
jgi:hypothetical protein